MTGLLASVTSVEEALMVLDAGADIIDLKDPVRGALGALPRDKIRVIVAAVDGRRPVSATVGDLPADVDLLSDAVMNTAETGVDFVKVGLFGQAHVTHCVGPLAKRAVRATRLIGVLFADLQPELSVIARLADAGFTGVMLDTADKGGGGLRRRLSVTSIASFVQESKRRGLLTGLAGSLSCDDIEPLLSTGADYLGFRTALCTDQLRTSQIHPTAVAAIRARIPHAHEGARPRRADVAHTVESVTRLRSA